MMGRKRRIRQNVFPYLVTTKCVDGLRGFAGRFRQLNRAFQAGIRVLVAEQNSKSEGKRSSKQLDQLAQQLVNSLLVAEKGRRLIVQHGQRKVAAAARRAKRLSRGSKSPNSKEKPPVVPIGVFNRMTRLLAITVIAYALKEILNLGFKLYHFVLLNDRYIMIGKTTENDISKVMHKFNWYIALEMNKLLGRRGAFFAQRYKSAVLGTDKIGALGVHYLYDSPVRAKLAGSAVDHDCTTFCFYAKGTNFLVDLSKECPLIAVFKEEGKDPNELLGRKLSRDLGSRLVRLFAKVRLWMDESSFNRLPVPLREALFDEFQRYYDATIRLADQVWHYSTTQNVDEDGNLKD